ncbi:Isonitrile hydratase [Alphaproteobacteria bacterium SO-S41]|nr:Isonitrile hydratase [Alphaproteobacteria bacterium SO-S41]
MTTPLQTGLLLYPGLTQLDLMGPYQVFSSTAGVQTHVVWKTTDPVASDTGLKITPTTSFADCPQLDVICVPGGLGQAPMHEDEEVLAFLRRQAAGARYVTSVCTGALILGAAGLLDGYRATTHWGFRELLPAVGAIYTPGRVVRDRNRITGGGVTAGIDMALTCVAELLGEESAQAVQLGIEYRPDPPFASGHPDEAAPEITALMSSFMAPLVKDMRPALEAALKGAVS